MTATHEDLLYPTLTDEQIEILSHKGQEVCFSNGETIFAEGKPADNIYIVLEGQIRITRKVGVDESLIAIHEQGEFTGELSLLTGGLAIATGRAVGACRVLRIDADTFRQLLGKCSPLTNTLVQALAGRRQNVDALAQQREKLASLGLMAAGLAHELNNPAGAALSAVQTLRATFHAQQELMLSMHRSMKLSPDQHACLIRFACEATEQSVKATPLDPITQSDREEDLIAWLDERNIANSYDLAPTFVTSGLDAAKLDEVVSRVEADVLGDVLAWIESMLKMRSLVDQIESSTSRVAKLVTSVKKYSYMDQAPIQEIDVHEGLDDTLTMLGYKLRKASITIEREYAGQLPRICAYGSELNQAWTNLIINAIDALETTSAKRKLTVRTRLDSDGVLVDIEDNGPGIPNAVQARIYDPFFTTKDVGKGTGMGLDITRRIIETRHHGQLRLTSEPGSTCFTIRLPIQPPKSQFDD
jgi:signal transduction histidine kinase